MVAEIVPHVRSGYASVLLLAMAASTCAAAGEQNVQPARAEDCPVTDVKGSSDYGNEYLRAILAWKDMTIVFGPNSWRLPDGSGRMKLAWDRLVPGKLTIEGRRLDGAAPPLGAWIPDGYGDIGGQSTALFFPTAGCWEVTGKVAGHSMTFVVRVVFKD
jgi:hypothetical protein